MHHLLKIGLFGLISISLMGCLPTEEDPDPNDDSMWTIQDGSAGLDGRNWRMINPSCEAIDAMDADASADSRQSVWTFNETDKTARHEVRIYLNNADCSSTTHDYVDAIEGDFFISSSEFDFNRIDFTVITTTRTPLTTAGVTALSESNSMNGACNGASWILNIPVDAAACDSTDDASLNGYSHNQNGVAVYAPGTKPEGVYRAEADDLALYVNPEGQRPAGSLANTFNYQNN